MSFRSDLSSYRSCGCNADGALRESSGSGSLSTGARFSHQTTGAVLDGEGDAAWRLRLGYSGRADMESGDIELRFSIWGDEGEYVYYGSGSLDATTATQSGHLQTYSGTFRVSAFPSTTEAVPRSGSFSATLDWWSDESSIWRVSFALVEG